MKLLVGRKFDDAEVQAELAKLPYKTVKLPNGGVGISIIYNDEPLVVSAEHAMAMMLVKAKDTSAKANANVNIGDAVLAVPHWFTEAQRRGVVQAAEIASLNVLKVANESTLVALSYGIFKSAKKLFSETEPQHIMFIDIGYTGMAVTIVDFIQVCIQHMLTLHSFFNRLTTHHFLSFHSLLLLTGKHEGAEHRVRARGQRPSVRRYYY